MARTSMVDIISRLRLMIGDNASSQQFTDAHIQDILDQYRLTYRYFPLMAAEDITTGGTVSFHEMWSGVNNWEGTAGGNLVFQDGTFGTIVPDTLNYLEGKFRFDTAPTRPVRATGFSYDMEAAAADLCDEWAAAVKLCITFSDGNQKFELSAKYAHLTNLADRLRRKQAPMTVTMRRSDVNAGQRWHGDDPRTYNKRLPRLGDY